MVLQLLVQKPTTSCIKLFVMHMNHRYEVMMQTILLHTLAAFGGTVAHYMPVPAKLVLQTTIPEEAKSNNEVEHFPDASRVTVRKRPTVTTIEAKPASCFIIFSSMAFIFATKLIKTLLVSFRGLYNNFEGEVVEVRDAKKSLMKMLLANNRTVRMIDSFTVLYVDQIIFSKKMEKEKG